jgi:hypothetical protein
MNGMQAKRFIRLKYELRSGNKTLPAETELEVIRANAFGARAVDAEGDIHVIVTSDFEWLPEDKADAQES